MSDPAPGSPLYGWLHGRPVLAVLLPYVILAILTASAMTGQWGSPGVNLALCALTAVWLLIPMHPAWRRRTPAMAVFLAGLIALMAVMVVRDPWFGFFAIAGYGYAVRLLPWPWRLAGVAGVAVLAATSQTAGLDRATPTGMAAYGAVIALNLLGVCGLVWLMHTGELQYLHRERAFDEVSQANRRLEELLAENAGLHEQLLAQAREAGILDERQRMAREIHDTLAQGLTGIITQLQAAEQASADPAGWRRHFAAAARLARESLTEARRSVDALRPGPLKTARLGDALAGVAERWSALHGITVQFTTTGEPRPVRPEAEFALLRTAQEALANVARHAHATRVGLTLSYLEDDVALDVRDDGRGFEPAADGSGAGPGSAGAGGPGHGGFGLVAMRQRMQGLSGTLQVESEPGAGTAVSARVPAATAEAPA